MNVYINVYSNMKQYIKICMYIYVYHDAYVSLLRIAVDTCQVCWLISLMCIMCRIEMQEFRFSAVESLQVSLKYHFYLVV
jgi:hypothetical protein